MNELDFKPDKITDTTKFGESTSVIAIGVVIFVALLGILFYNGAFEERYRNKTGSDILFTNLYRNYNIKPFESSIFVLNGLSGQFSILNKEPCDKNAIVKAGNILAGSQYKREAIGLLLGHAGVCPNSSLQMVYAGNIMLNLGNFKEAYDISEKAVHENPNFPPSIFLRARALKELGRYEDAIDGFSDTIRSTRNLPDMINPTIKAISEGIISKSYTDMALSYAAIGKYCEAASTIQTYIATDYDKHNSDALLREIEKYESQGACGSGYASGKQVTIPIGKGLIIVRVLVNGVPGNFLIDTGASFVAMTTAFAEKLQLGNLSGNHINLDTANGEIQAKMITAAKISLGGLSAANVPSVILKKTLGKDVDGLLGLSFLSRFSIKTVENTMTITKAIRNSNSEFWSDEGLGRNTTDKLVRKNSRYRHNKDKH